MTYALALYYVFFSSIFQIFFKKNSKNAYAEL
jgi:hypothetical protein